MSGKHIINKIQVTGGFLEDINIEFSDKMNCIIGARGTGKTTILEFIRHAFELDYNRPSEERIKKNAKLVNDNLSTGRIKVSITNSDDFSYIVERNKTGEQIILNDDGDITKHSLRHGLMFRADIYSQDQIEEIADKTKYQIELIDEFNSDKIAEINKRIGELLHQLSENARKIAENQLEAGFLLEELQQIPDIENQLKKYKEKISDDSEEVNKAHAEKTLRESEKRLLTTVIEELTASRSQLSDVENRLSNILPYLINEDIKKGKNSDFFKEFEKKITKLIKQYVSSIKDVVNKISIGISSVQNDDENLDLTHKKQEKGFQDLLEQHKEIKEKSEKRIQLERLQTQLKDQLADYEKKNTLLASLNAERGVLYRDLMELREERFNTRKEIVEFLDSQIDFVQISIQPDTGTLNYHDKLVEALEGSETQYNRYIPKITSNLHPMEFFDLIHSHSSPVETLHEKTGINKNQARTVVERLKSKDILFDIQTVELLDEPLIQLLDGETPKKSSDLSTGQKCTTILPILLLQDTSPLLIDQPEDNLDNAFISDIVVKGLEKVKQNRQLIFITHNPNIPVLAECERIIILKSDGKKANVEGIGNLDETQSLIELYLEGGHDAFLKRAKRYAKKGEVAAND